MYHGVRTGCLIAILNQNAYMHEQITKEFEGTKYLYDKVLTSKCTHMSDVGSRPLRNLHLDENSYIAPRLLPIAKKMMFENE